MKTKLKQTRQRKVMLAELEKTKQHPTADELFRSVRKRLPKISLGTVYRNLEILSRQGLVNKLSSGGGPMRFDLNTHEHHHLYCVRCGRIEDLELGPKTLEVNDDHGYLIQNYSVEFKGLCPECRKRDKITSRKKSVDN